MSKISAKWNSFIERFSPNSGAGIEFTLSALVGFVPLYTAFALLVNHLTSNTLVFLPIGLVAFALPFSAGLLYLCAPSREAFKLHKRLDIARLQGKRQISEQNLANLKHQNPTAFDALVKTQSQFAQTLEVLSKEHPERSNSMLNDPVTLNLASLFDWAESLVDIIYSAAWIQSINQTNTDLSSLIATSEKAVNDLAQAGVMAQSLAANYQELSALRFENLAQKEKWEATRSTESFLATKPEGLIGIPQQMELLRKSYGSIDDLDSSERNQHAR